MTNESKFLSKLSEFQKELGYSNSQMAERLGCSVQLYRETMTGKQPVGMTILKGAVKIFPEISNEALSFLTDRTVVHQKPPHQVLLALWAKIRGFIGRIRK